MSDGLPEGWATTTLASLLIALESGSRPRGGVRGISKGIPSIGGEHLNYDGTFDFSSVRYVPEEFANSMTKGRIRTNDILMVKDGATTGKTAFVDSSFPFSDAFVNEHVFICRPTSLIEPRFLFRFLMSSVGQERILENFKGSAQGGINQSFAPNTELPLAPFSEQLRIAAKLEKLLGQVDACQQRLARIPALLKRFRQAILAAACSGRLTADWREKAHDEELELIEPANPKVVVEVEEILETPAYWRWLPLHALCDPGRSVCYGVIKLGAEYPAGVPCLRTSDVKPLHIDTADVKCIAPEVSGQYQRTLLRGGEVLVNVRGTLGGVAIVPENLRGWNISREVAIVPVEGVLSKFVAFWIASMPSQLWLTGVAKGVAYTGINIEDLRLLPIALPSLPEQKEIVCRVEALFELADQIEARHGKAQTYVGKLTLSMLTKAFRGELVPTEAELARAEGRTYESALVLLERIRANTPAPKTGQALRRPRRGGRSST